MATQTKTIERKQVITAAAEKATEAAAHEAASKAISIAETLAQDEQFNSDLEEALKADETRARSPLYLLMDLRATLGETMDSLPVPDSTEEDVKGTNNMPDWYATIVRDKDGIPKAGEQSFYQDIADKLPAGRAAIAEMDGIKAALGGSADAPERYANKGKPVLVSLQSTQRQRLNRVKKVVITAVKLHQQMAAVNSLPRVGVDYLVQKGEDGGEELVPTNLPMQIYNSDPKNAEERGQVKAVAISQFLTINVDKARELGGTFEAVMKAMERKKRAPRNQGTENESDKGLEPFATVPEAADAMDEFYAFLSDKDKFTAFMRRQQKPDEIGDQMTLTMGDLFNEVFAPWWQNEANQKRYRKLVETASIGNGETKTAAA